MKGDRVEALVDTGGGVQTFEIVATKAGRRIEVNTARGVVEVAEVTRFGKTVRTGRFMARTCGAKRRRRKENAMSTTDRTRKAQPPADTGSPTMEPRRSAALRRSTGRDRGEWFAVLDAWGAPGRPYREIADWLTGEHGVSDWWAQKLIVEYEQARGLRDAGVRRDGTFAGGASKTIAVSVQSLFDAFVDASQRERWLPGVVLRERTLQPGRSARFDWDDGISRVNVTFATQGSGKSQVAVEHDHLPDARAAAERKAFWRVRLAALKSLLEGGRHGSREFDPPGHTEAPDNVAE